MSSFTQCPPLVAIPPDYKLYEVQCDFEYHVGFEESIEIIRIPKGFISDGASIPQFAWSLLGSPLGEYSAAAIVHDYCYRYQLYTRWRCDRIFLEAMQVLGVALWKRLTMFWAVRIFAFMAWNKYRKEMAKNG